jgi:hypothetical protein
MVKESLRKLLKMRLTPREKKLLAAGICPKCGAYIRGPFLAPTGSFAPEAYETMRELGVDFNSGHQISCPLVGVSV